MLYVKDGITMEVDKSVASLFARNGWTPYVEPITIEVPKVEVDTGNETLVNAENKNDVTKYTEEQLSEMKASEIKKLGAELGYSITAVKQTDCIKQFLAQQG